VSEVFSEDFVRLVSPLKWERVMSMQYKVAGQEGRELCEGQGRA
jgi:hypothetical protein